MVRPRFVTTEPTWISSEWCSAALASARDEFAESLRDPHLDPEIETFVEVLSPAVHAGEPRIIKDKGIEIEAFVFGNGSKTLIIAAG